MPSRFVFVSLTRSKVKVKKLSHVRLLATPWTAAYQAPLSMGFFQARVLEWGAIAFSSGTISNAPTYELYKSQKKKRKRKGMRNFLKIILENCPNMEIVNQVQEAQRVPYRINPRRNIPRHILTKLTKTKLKERILKEAREKQQVTYKGNPICLTADLLAETLQARREWQDIFKILKGKNLQPRLLYWQGSHSKLMEK